MARYRMTPVSPTLQKITLGRDTIGWCRKFELQWVATTKLGRGEGPTASAAFQDMVRGRNNHVAQQAGFADAREMVEKQNAKVRQEVNQMNQLLREAGLPGTVRVRASRRRVLV